MKKPPDDPTLDLFSDVAVLDKPEPKKRTPVRARHTDPETSHAAARKAEPRQGTIRGRIIAYLEQAGAHGGTCLEIVHATGIGQVSASPSFKPMETDGFIVRKKGPDGAIVKRKAATGADGEVWILPKWK